MRHGKAAVGFVAALCTCSWLIVVEKDAVFQRLVEDRIFDHIPCVLVTAKGMPDLATRALCAKLTVSASPPV
jgi:DNA topoisomerase VI subunit A